MSDILLILDVSSDLVDLEVCIDEGKLKQVLINLVSNALKFTPKGGRITVSVTASLNGVLRISVLDTGVGMCQVMLLEYFLRLSPVECLR